MNDLGARLAALSTGQRAQLSARLAAPQPEPGGIAVIGIGCRFPGGANSPEEFWHALSTGVDAVQTAPADRWNADQSFSSDSDAAGKINARWGGFLDRVDQFDAEYFGLSPREAMHMDPQQRLLLETAFEALEDAGQLTESLRGRAAGVFIGAQSHSSDYYLLQARDREGLDTYTATGTAHSILANRISFLLDLHGPSLAVDTACSSSLVAVHLACQSLRTRECDIAIAGGVNLILTPDFHICLSKLEMMAPDGRCKTFDHRANGFVRGEGCGVVVLKRLADAIRDANPIMAVILGSAVNQDGASNGLTAPSGSAQKAVIRRALEAAKVAPAQVSYVETHGTGTALGDPIEVEALSEVLGSSAARAECCLGALKTNIGHLEAAAGIAGLIKAILCLKHGAIPPNLHFEKANPHLALETTRFILPDALRPWPRNGEPRVAGVSSFGFGGTNAHIIVGDAPQLADQPESSKGDLVLTISARSEPALRELAAAYIDFLTHGLGATLPPSAIAYTAAHRRRRHEYCWSVSGAGSAKWAEELGKLLAKGSADSSVEPAGDIPASGRCVQLPRYPWQRKRHWLPQANRNEAPDEWFYELDWQDIPRRTSLRNAPATFVVIGGSDLACEVQRQLEARGDVCHRASGDSPEELRALCRQAGPGRKAVYLTDGAADDMVEACQRPLRAVQALLADDSSAGFWLVTRGSQAIDCAPSPADAAAWGLGRDVALEAPELSIRLVDIDPALETASAATALLAEIDGADSEDQIALRGGRRLAARLKRSPAARGLPLRAKGSHLVTGALGSLGSHLALHLAAAGAEHLILVVRRALPDRSLWSALAGDDPDFVRVDVVRRLEAMGVKVTVATLDLADETALPAWFAALTPGDLRGIWHTAMSFSSAPLAELDAESVRAMMRVKAEAARQLDALTRSHPVEHFVLFSSTTALWGATGLAHYAAANTCLEGIAHSRRAAGLPGTVVNWGIWKEMRGRSAAERDRATRAGLRPMPAASALAALDRVLSAGMAQAVVADIDWTVFKPAYESRRSRPFLERIELPASEQKPAESTVIDKLNAAPADERRDRLASHLQEILGGILGMAPGELIDRDRGFFDLGMDSLTAIQLRTRLQADLGRTFSNTLTFNYSAINRLADYLAGELFPKIAEPAKQAAVTVRDRVPERAQPANSAAIAIVGIGCRYPGGITGPDSFWQLLREGVDAITEVPAERWGLAEWYDADRNAPGKMSTRWGGFMDGVDRFDAHFFGIAPREAAALDPQHRILLEVAWEALEHAGQPFAELAGSQTGLFVGLTNNEYYQHLLHTLPPAELSPYLITGNVLNAAAGRIAFHLGTRGPSVAVDTACSSSLTAIHMACQGLRAGDCRMALAGGVNVIVIPETAVMFSKWGMMAADGRCKAFDAAADGFVRSEGCGMVVLKRLDDALADGDRVLAVIEGSAINQDGHSSGLTVPNGAAQQALIRQALANAGVEPGQIDYIEAHGTGTPIGDPIEVSALAAVFGPGRDARRKLRIGSVKTNLGHTESASGVAGLIKCILALQHEEIPAQLHLKQPTAEIDWDATPIEIAARSVPWRSGAVPRRAGVSSFGFSGANAHVIVGEAPATGSPGAGMERPRHIFTLSAASPEALTELVVRHATVLSESALPLGDYCFTANTGRAHLRHRAAICASDSGELLAALSQFAGGTKVFGEPVKVAFVFGGQGSQYAGIGIELYGSQPVFRAELDRCAMLAAPHLDRPLLEIVAAPAAAQSQCARAALFAVEWSLAQLWRSWGVEPAGLLGEGVGWIAASCQAGEMSLEEGFASAAVETSGGNASIAERVREFTAKGCGIFIEIGSSSVTAARPYAGDATFLPTLSQGRDEWTQILDSLVQLYLRGVPIDWSGFDQGYGRHRVALPTYPFQRKRFWVDPSRPLLQRQPGSPLIRESVFSGSVALNLHPWLVDHVVEAQVIVPLTAYVEMAIEAGVELLKSKSLVIEDLLVREPLIAGKDAQVQLVASPVEGRDGWDFRIIAIDGSGGHVVHATCSCHRLANGASKEEFPKLAGASEINAEEHYQVFANHGIVFGPAFRGVQMVKRAGGIAIGEIRGGVSAQYRFHPALLDACLQPLIHTWPMEESAFVPFAVERIEIHGEPGTAMTSVCHSGSALAGDVTIFNSTGQLIAMVRGLNARRLEQESNSIYEIEWTHSASVETKLPAAPLAAAGALRNRSSYLPSVPEYTEAMRVLEVRSHAHIRAALQTNGLEVVPKYRQLVERLRGASAPIEANGSLDIAELTLLERCGSRLADILRGECNPLEILFDPALSGTLESIYSTSLSTSTVNRLAADAVAGIAEQSTKQKLRILEIGAGTGGTTRHVLSLLPADRVEYWFTDLSPALVGRARTEFREHPFMRFEVVDIEQNDEALRGQEFDVIIAANVLHATADLRDSLARVRRLLSPGGLLVLIEGTRPQTWIDLTFGLTDGWWRFTDRDLRPDYPLLGSAAWHDLLEGEGFSNSIELPGPAAAGSPSDFSVFVANKAAAKAGEWLILCDESDTGHLLADALERGGQSCVKVTPAEKFVQYGPCDFGIGRDSRDDYDRVLACAVDGFSGVINLWPLNSAVSETSSSSDVMEAQGWSCRSLLYLSQALAATGRPLRQGLWTITRGSQAIAGDVQRLSVAQSTAWGFAKTLALEHPELRAIRLDLDPSADGAEAERIAEMLLRPPVETQLALRGGNAFTSRLVKKRPAAEPMELVAAENGRLDSLEWKPAQRRTPGSGEVEIQVEASALNFRDVLSVLGLYPGEAGPLGGEVAGRIVGVGPGVTGVSVGDAVGALAFGGFNSHVVTAADLTIKKPAGWSFAEIATVPAAFSTVYHSLVQLARVRRGERVLIHTAAGGVGLAAIQVARQAGCKIIATAGSAEKRDYLRSLGIEHVFDSRSVEFGAGILNLFPGGVDVILNTLSGESIQASLGALSQRGRFIELGKREIWDASRVAAVRPEAEYFIVDLAAASRLLPELFRPIFAAASEAIEAGHFQPLPQRIYRREDAQEAFRHMAQARHIGKIVVACSGNGIGQSREFSARPDASYLITGGLSGLGLRTAEWLVTRGAQHLALMARGEPDFTAAAKLESLRRGGVQVLVCKGDVAQPADVKRVLGEIGAALPALRGVIHSAGVLDDGAVLQQDWSRFESVFLPKVAGAWNLHAATSGMPLDLFVCYSSASAILGSRGQTNHAAANAFLDALAHHRRGLGLAGLSINWGAWSGIGAAARGEVLSRVGEYGVKPITPEAGIAALERLIAGGVTQAAVVPMNWSRFLASLPESERSFFQETSAASVVHATAPTPETAAPAMLRADDATPGERRKNLQSAVRDTIISVLGLEPDFQLDPLQGLTDLGMDSLTSIELRNRLQGVVGHRLPATLAFDFPSLAALVNYLCPKAPEPVVALDPELEELGQLSDEQTEQLLADELAKVRALL